MRRAGRCCRHTTRARPSPGSEAETRATQPSLLVFLGDSFHDASAEDRLPPDEAQRIGALATGRRLVWIVGNHDEEGPRRLPGESLPSFDLAGLRLVHEPAPRRGPGEVAGHLHPCAKVRGPGGRSAAAASSPMARGWCCRLSSPGGRPEHPRRGLPPALQPPAAGGVLGRGRVHPVAWASLSDD